jgi:hypothetical protein
LTHKDLFYSRPVYEPFISPANIKWLPFGRPWS